MSPKRFDSEKVNVILATDVGSTTTKAILIKRIGNEYRLVARGEAPTTVEAPFEDVRVGVRNAVKEVEELTGEKLLSEKGIKMKKNEFDEGVDIYVSTSSAGGGLQMVVAGLVKTMTAESAERAALGAGAIVMDVVALDDGRKDYEKIKRIRQFRPDMVLLAGGVDGGNVEQVLKIVNLFAMSKPKPRLGTSFKLPVVYAGNVDARKKVKDMLKAEFSLKVIPNIRPTLDVENTEPARHVIHELFLEHVMSHAPGYPDLMKWTSTPIMPTPLAVGKMIQKIAEHFNINIIGTDPGGATTDIFSVFNGRFVRTVSANLGLSYSICNVMKETGIENILRWIPLELEESYVRNVLRNKMIRPTTIPQTYTSLMIEQAVNREAMRLAFEHHKRLATGLRGVRKGTAAERGFVEREEETYIKMIEVDMIIGSGGPNAHAPNRAQAASMLIDAFQPEGITKLAVDSVFMLPHLGVLAEVHPKAALDVLLKDCLVPLGTCIAPVGEGKDGINAVTVKVKMPDGSVVEEVVKYGAIKRIALKEYETAEVEIKPYKSLDVGMGKGKTVKTLVEGGVVGIIIDARGRPLILPEDKQERDRKLIQWYTGIGAYPREIFE